MRSLDQIEPRTPISSLPFTITSSGVYYLTKSLTATGDGITISASDVVLDLGGYTLTGDLGSADSGVQISANLARITVRNGTLRRFGIGLFLFSGASDCLFEDLILSENANSGAFCQANASGAATRCIFRRLRFVANTTSGLSLGNSAGGNDSQNVIEHCLFFQNTNIGLNVSSSGNLIMNCRASGNGTNYSITANNRGGVFVVPPLGTGFSGSSGGAGGSGTSDPLLNLSF